MRARKSPITGMVASRLRGRLRNQAFLISKGDDRRLVIRISPDIHPRERNGVIAEVDRIMSDLGYKRKPGRETGDRLTYEEWGYRSTSLKQKRVPQFPPGGRLTTARADLWVDPAGRRAKGWRAVEMVYQFPAEEDAKRFLAQIERDGWPVQANHWQIVEAGEHAAQTGLPLGLDYRRMAAVGMQNVRDLAALVRQHQGEIDKILLRYDAPDPPNAPLPAYRVVLFVKGRESSLARGINYLAFREHVQAFLTLVKRYGIPIRTNQNAIAQLPSVSDARRPVRGMKASFPPSLPGGTHDHLGISVQPNGITARAWTLTLGERKVYTFADEAEMRRLVAFAEQHGYRINWEDITPTAAPARLDGLRWNEAKQRFAEERSRLASVVEFWQREGVNNLTITEFTMPAGARIVTFWGMVDRRNTRLKWATGFRENADKMRQIAQAHSWRLRGQIPPLPSIKDWPRG